MKRLTTCKVILCFAAGDNIELLSRTIEFEIVPRVGEYLCFSQITKAQFLVDEVVHEIMENHDLIKDTVNIHSCYPEDGDESDEEMVYKSFLATGDWEVV